MKTAKPQTKGDGSKKTTLSIDEGTKRLLHAIKPRGYTLKGFIGHLAEQEAKRLGMQVA